ncbi:MAG: RNA methyltransferase [Bacteroidia bacterium]|nr:RNA methyltransferase [Bacteroidia bacterium]
MYISSPTNHRIKNLLRLYERSSERREQGAFVTEGRKEIDLALESGYELLEFYHCTKLGSPVPSVTEDRYFEISATAFEKIAYRENTDGVIAVFRTPDHSLSNLKPGKSALVIVLERVEKPGNLGAVLRIADGCNADALLICDPRTDLYNPNVIRSSVGCVFTRKIGVAGLHETQQWLTENKLNCFTASPEASKNYFEQDLTAASAFIFGTEHEGLSEAWDAIGIPIRIPMLGKNDSLNVAASVSVITYEAIRQRLKIK